MGTIDSVTEEHAYRLRDRIRRVVVASLTPSSDTDATFSLAAADVGLNSIESVELETPFISGGDKYVNWDRENDQFEVRDVSDQTDNSADISGETIVAVVTGPVE